MQSMEHIGNNLYKYKQILQDKGYNVAYIGVYGSQNYGLDDDKSDIDVKAIIIPSLHDIIFRKATSTTIECEEGNIDVKDLITFYDVIKKGNFSYIEAIHSLYWIGDVEVRKLFYDYKTNLKSIVGAMYEKQKALTHEYPSKKEEFEKFGLDPKQFHHIIRLYDLLEQNCEEKEYSDDSYICYPDGEYKDYLITIKRGLGIYTRESMIKECDKYVTMAKELLNNSYPDYKYEVIDMDDKVNQYLEKCILEELKGRL